MKKAHKRIGEFLGGFSGHLPILLITILIYVVLSILTYLLLFWTLEKIQNPFLITYIVATGGDPAPYLPILESNPIAYYWILIFHVVSWLFLPVVIALTADATYRLHEQKKSVALRKLKRKMTEVLSNNKPELTSAQIEDSVNQMIDSWQYTIDDND